MKRVTLLDYGAGNLTSVEKAFAHLGCEVTRAADAKAISRAEYLVLPGVGNFSVTARLTQSGLRAIALAAISAHRPFLGICVGLQWLFSGSEESQETPGAAVFEGTCQRLGGNVKVPHVGWNTLEQTRSEWLLRGITPGTSVYFTHSYAAPVIAATAAVTTHGVSFSSAVEHDRLGGVQFHPEKSGDAGLQVLRNFLELPC